jgi:hypothetical protein
MNLSRFSQTELYEFDRSAESDRRQAMADERRDDEIERQMERAAQQSPTGVSCGSVPRSASGPSGPDVNFKPA